MADKKISQLTSLAQGDIATTTDVLAIVDTSATETKKATPAAIVGAAAAAGLTSVDINSGAIDGTTIGANSAAAGTFTNLTASGTVSFSGATVSNGGSVTTVDINGGTIDGATIATSDITVGSGKTLNVSAGTLTLADNQISGDKVEGGTINAITINTLTSTTVNTTTVDATNVEVTNIKAKDGTAAASIADSTGIVSLSANPILSGGTANGVLYLDGSKVATSGSSLSFNGTTLTAPQMTLTSANGITMNSASGGLIDCSGNTLFIQFPSSNSLIFRQSGSPFTEYMRLTSTGLGIGTTSPAYKLDVDRGASNGVVARFGRSSGQFAHIYADTASVYFGSDNGANTAWQFNESSDYLAAWTAGSERLRIDSSGNLGIGTTSPGGKFNVDFGNYVGVGARFQYNSSNTPFCINALNNSGDAYISWNAAAKSGSNTSTYVITGGSTKIEGGGSQFIFYNAPSGSAGADITYSERMRLDTSGNLGLGVTPSAWTSNIKALEGASGGALSFYATGGFPGTFITSNAYSDGTNWIAKVTDQACLYTLEGTTGKHIWSVAASNTTAGNAITFTQAMTLDSSGNLSVANGDITIATNGKKLYTNYIANNSGTNLNFDAANFLFNTGNVGIGVSNSPLSKLVVRTGTNENIEFRSYSAIMGTGTGVALDSLNDARNSVVDWAVRGTNIALYGSGSTPMTFYTNSTERARITATGEFLVGTSDASATSGAGNKLLANGQYYGVMAASTNSDTTLQVYSTGAGAYRFYVGLGGTVYATNTTISAISDQRYKENIRDLDVGLDAILALKPRKFDWKEGQGKNIKDDRGFIAQEFEQVFPDLVDEWKDSAPEGEEPYKSVRQDLIPVLVKAIQELKAELDATKAKVAQLEAR